MRMGASSLVVLPRLVVRCLLSMPDAHSETLVVAAAGNLGDRVLIDDERLCSNSLFSFSEESGDCSQRCSASGSSRPVA
jgi:hypothetical protein